MFHIIDSGYAFTHHTGIEINRPGGTSHYVFVFFRSPCEFETEDGYISCQDHYILMEPEIKHHYRSSFKPFVNDWIHFEVESPAAIELIRSFGLILNKPVPLDDAKFVTQLIKLLQTNRHMIGTDAFEERPVIQNRADVDSQLAGSGSKSKRDLVDTGIMLTLFESLSAFQTSRHQDRTYHNYYPAFASIRNDLYSLPQAGLRIQELADRAGLSLSRFQHLYREIFMCTVGEDIAKGRLKRALYLLENSDLPVAVIAQDSGYTNETHMIRHFNKYIGRSPGRYRRELSF
ncbi:MAG: helix-turn-helix transcriptional regulator [Clostridiaceae bacterium]|nr:helix-turn-helix transcriptional regulator [Clostridiaceae bacterium]